MSVIIWWVVCKMAEKRLPMLTTVFRVVPSWNFQDQGGIKPSLQVSKICEQKGKE